MDYWQIGLIALAIAWAVQAVGTWRQMRHYREVMSSISGSYDSGRLGSGNARGSLGKGVIAIVVVDDADTVRKLMIMEGRSVFAKFHDHPEFAGRPLAEVLATPPFPEKEAGRNRAVTQAIEQIMKAKAAVPPAAPAAARA